MTATATITVEIKESAKSSRGGNIYQYDKDLDGVLTLEQLFEFTKSSLITIADEVLKEELQRGFPKKFLTLVDGDARKPIFNVSPLGRIEFISAVSSVKIIEDTYEAITQRTKIVTGTYSKHNWVYYNGSIVATTKSELKSWIKTAKFTFKDRIRFVNVAPYAARLERLGVSAGSTSVRKASPKKDRKGNLRPPAAGAATLANGAYYLAVRQIKRLYKSNSIIRFEFKFGDVISAPSIRLPTGAGRTTYASGKLKGSSYLYPTILISLQDFGTTDVANKNGVLQ